MEEEIQWVGGRPTPADEAVAGREHAVEAHRSRSDAGQGHAAGCAKKKILKPSRCRPVVEYLSVSYQISERRACRVTRVHRAMQARVRYGYRKILVLLNREGWKVGKTLVQRLYQEEGLVLKHRPKRRRRAAERMRTTEANQVWSLDFVADQLTDGRRFRALTIVDVHTRESLAIEVGQALKGTDVVGVLNRLRIERRAPKTLFCDNGAEFTSQILDLWAHQNGVKIDFSRPGKPTDNAFVESFNGTLRAECLDTHWFGTLLEAKQSIEAWRQEYSETRPHRALGEGTPNEFALALVQKSRTYQDIKTLSLHLD
jgi:putative transposase